MCLNIIYSVASYVILMQLRILRNPEDAWKNFDDQTILETNRWQGFLCLLSIKSSANIDSRITLNTLANLLFLGMIELSNYRM